MKAHSYSLEATFLLLATGWLCFSKPTEDRSPLLPPSLNPESYELSIDPNLTWGVFHGVAIISGVAVDRTSRITLHCSNLLFNTTTLTDLTEGKGLEVVDLQEDRFLQKCHLLLNTSLQVDHEYKLSIKYTGVIGNEGFGLYKDVYKEGGVKHDILMTHLQPNFARTLFPCWDEPHYKAQFLLKVTRGRFSTVLSNMPALSAATPDSGWVEFEETLPMSPYLVVIVWCDYVVLGDSTSNNSVWAPRDRLHEAQWALNISNAVLDQCERYFGRDYALPKLDHIPLPSLSNVAMENWGAITYKQDFLLWEEGVSTWAQKEMTAYAVCHEIVHQWLGNLVTTTWWNTTWLNEGVTSFYHYLLMDKIEPTWDVMDTTFVNQVQIVFEEEVNSDTTPLTNNAPMAQDRISTTAFSTTTYLKGAAIIRMVYYLMSPDIFREAIAQYVTDNQFGSVDEEDLWQSLAAAADLPVDLEVAMYSWTHQPGFPLITVHRSPDGCISVRQEKYLSKDESDIRWFIPLTYTTSDELDFNLTNTVWFHDDTDQLDLEECLKPEDWIIVNIRQSGFYRVNYDLHTWDALTHDLLNCDLHNIHPINRAQLLNDGFDLARHGLLDYRIILNLSRYLKRETEPLPWTVAIQNLNTIRDNVYNTDVFPYFQSYVRELVDEVFSTISLTDDLGDLLPETHRRQIVDFACLVRHPRCVKEATSTTYLLLSGVHVKIPVDLKPLLLCSAVRFGQDEVWHFVLKEYLLASDNERWKYLEALACTNNPDTVKRILEDLTDPSLVKREDRINMLVEMGKQDDNLGPMLDMILEYVDELAADFDLEVILDVLKTFMKPYITPEQKQKIRELSKLVESRKIPKELDLMEALSEGMTSHDFQRLKEDSVKEWFINEVKELPVPKSSPPSLRKHTAVNVHFPTEQTDFSEEDDEDEDLLYDLGDTQFPPTESPSENHSPILKASTLLVTLTITLMCVVLS